MDYTWENISSKEFEIVACNFANDMFPAYEWKLTSSTRDDNHDFFANAGVVNKWGEAKHSQICNKPISRSQWDPTLVSAKLVNSVNDILLITCAHIPLSYIIRSFQMTVKPIDNVYCINRVILNNWYSKKHTRLLKFNTNISIDKLEKSVGIKSYEKKYNDEVQLFLFNNITKNYLTIIKELIPGNSYTINIAIFTTEKEKTFELSMNPYMAIIGDITIKNLSYIGNNVVINELYNNNLTCSLSEGYSIINFQVIVNQINEEKKYININCKLGKKQQYFNFAIKKQDTYDRNVLINIEKLIADNQDGQNTIIQTQYLSPYLYNRPNFTYLYIRFDERYNYNCAQLCRLAAHIITGIDFLDLDEIALKDNLYLCDYPETLENIILGIFNDSLSAEALENVYSKPESIIQPYNDVRNSIYIIENSDNLNTFQKSIIIKIQQLFSSSKNNSYIIFQSNQQSTLNVCLDDYIALVGIFETGIMSEYIKTSKNLKIYNLITENIDNSLYYPSLDLSIVHVKKYVLSKNNNELALFFDKVIEIASNQIWSSRVFDFMILLENHIPNDIFYKTIRKLRDIYYNRTRFDVARQYSVILHNDPIRGEEQTIDDMYKEADELNHCGSIIESKRLFDEVANRMLASGNKKFLLKGIEALTEVFNIRFWILDVDGLVSQIDEVMKKYFDNKITNIKSTRELYPYYNCLNRKMVTQYLLGDYINADISYQFCLNNIKLKNYIAFTHMDSARGLYYININLAYERLESAFVILKDLYDKGFEIRRYYDCMIEKKYVEFILADSYERQVKIQNLVNAIYNARKYGYKNITKKSYYKLAACYMVLGDKQKCIHYLNKISNDPYLNESPRNQLMYNELMKGYYHLMNHNYYIDTPINYDYCNVAQTIEFNCFNKKQSGDSFFIETRLW